MVSSSVFAWAIMASASAISERATATCSPSPARNIVFSSRIATVCSSNSLHSSTAVRRVLLRLHQCLLLVRADKVPLVLLHQCDLDLVRQLLHLAHRVLKGHGRVLRRKHVRRRIPLGRGHRHNIGQRYQNESHHLLSKRHFTGQLGGG